jgi:DNA transposition AAA+ family ATPase
VLARSQDGSLSITLETTTLILVDEVDRLQMNSLEQMRSIFDEGNAGMVLVGMPGIEKRIARFPQFYSRIGFVHEFRPLDATEMLELLEQRWTPVGVTLQDEPLTPEVIARLIRMTGGNFRLLTRLQTQIERVLEVPGPDRRSKCAVGSKALRLGRGERSERQRSALPRLPNVSRLGLNHRGAAMNCLE